MLDLFLNFLIDYGTFFLKTITIGLIIIFVITGIFSSLSRNRISKDGVSLKIRNLNEFYQSLKKSLQVEIEEPGKLKKILKAEKKQKKKEKKEKKDEIKERVFVLEFEGDIKASAVENLACEVNGILTVADPNDEVVVKVSSPGGMVNTYGLCAGHLKRIRDRGIPLTVCVDKVAASGGYLMACMANKIIVAPFSIIGSIGVVAAVPNFHRLLKQNNIDYELHTSGDFKRTLTTLGKNTAAGREKFKEQLQMTHDLFKTFVKDYRQSVDIDKVSTGEFWYGYQSKDLNLADSIQTSDDYLMEQSETANLYQITCEKKEGVLEKIKINTRFAFRKIHSLVFDPFSQ